VTDFDISPNSIYQQQELHVLVTVSLFMDLTITYKYQSTISNDINILCCVCFYFVAFDVSLGFHFCVCYVNPAYGCQIQINCMYIVVNNTLSAQCQCEWLAWRNGNVVRHINDVMIRRARLVL